ncbi:MAG: aminotransferase class V-fold PLP-dependent enzyme [Candidatus Omnitrophica bacterium]|nr:aminotransferase class V-fold PLP-dependent enzyme [Candidatus Omnitrophota bacterium]
MRKIIYFDHNATAPVRPEVLEAMAPFWREFMGNPSSIHQAGRLADKAVREARRETAHFLGAEESEIIFTSGGAESNNTVFRSVISTEKGKREIVTTTVEHSTVLKPVRALQEERIEVTFLPVDESGALNLEKLEESLTPETALVSVMMANNETGVLFPIEKIGRKVREKGILFHVDAVQAVGKIPVSLRSLPVDFLSLSAHKFGGPKGVGALYLRKGTPFRPLLVGGAQERGRRAGTQNVPGIAGLGAALRGLKEGMDGESQRVKDLRDDFEEKVLRKIPSVQVNGDRQNRLPNTSNLAFEDVDQEALLILLDEAGLRASQGSACFSGSPEPSHVLRAMGFSEARAKSSVRFSFGAENTREEVGVAVELLVGFVGRLRKIELEHQHPHSVVR